MVEVSIEEYLFRSCHDNHIDKINSQLMPVAFMHKQETYPYDASVQRQDDRKTSLVVNDLKNRFQKSLQHSCCGKIAYVDAKKELIFCYLSPNKNNVFHCHFIVKNLIDAIKLAKNCTIFKY